MRWSTVMSTLIVGVASACSTEPPSSCQAGQAGCECVNGVCAAGLVCGAAGTCELAGSVTSTGVDSSSDTSSPSSSTTTSETSGVADSTTGAAETGAAEVLPTDLYPLAVGNEWVYETTDGQPYPGCSDEPVMTQTVEDLVPWAGKRAFRIDNICGFTGYFVHENDEVVGHFANAWDSFLEAPVEEGYTWTFATLEYHWEAYGSIEVPAGSFTDCWTIANASGGNIACPGVGIVRGFTTGGLVWELTSYVVR